MYKPDTLTRRGSLRSLRSAPLLSTVLESTLSLTRIHPIASLELPGLDYAVQSQSAIGGFHHRELGTSLRSGIAAITAASASGISQSQSALLGRYGPNASIRNSERKIVQPKRYVNNNRPPKAHPKIYLSLHLLQSSSMLLCIIGYPPSTSLGKCLSIS